MWDASLRRKRVRRRGQTETIRERSYHPWQRPEMDQWNQNAMHVYDSIRFRHNRLRHGAQRIDVRGWKGPLIRFIRFHMD